MLVEGCWGFGCDGRGRKEIEGVADRDGAWGVDVDLPCIGGGAFGFVGDGFTVASDLGRCRPCAMQRHRKLEQAGREFSLEDDRTDFGAALPDQRGFERGGRPMLCARIEKACDGVERITIRERKSRWLVKQSDLLGVCGMLAESVGVKVQLRADGVVGSVPFVGASWRRVCVILCRVEGEAVCGIVLFGGAWGALFKAVEGIEQARAWGCVVVFVVLWAFGAWGRWLGRCGFGRCGFVFGWRGGAVAFCGRCGGVGGVG